MNGQSNEYRIINDQSALSRWEFLTCLGILLVATYVLAPRFWEPGGESWKNWVSARILRETGGFTVLHHGPLYNIYLQIFLSLDYPLSFQLEHIVTRLFTNTAVFLLLRGFLPSAPALLLTCAWIPTLWTVQAGARVAGIGFFALYLQTGKRTIVNGGYFPVSLVSAFLCDLAFLPFFLGHVVGVVLEKCSSREPLIAAAYALRRETILPVIVKSALVALLALAILFQSQRPDNNVHAFDYPWVPFSQTNALTEAFVQAGNWKYVMQNVPKDQWIYQDWYFTHKDAFGGASTLPQAAINKPAFVFRIILDNLYGGAARIPFQWIFGFSFPERLGLIFGSWLLAGVGLYGVFQYCVANKLQTHFVSIVFGTIGVVCALSLVWFSNRFVSVLLSVGLMIIVHIAKGLGSLIKLARSRVSFNAFVVKAGTRESRIYNVFGSLFVLLGLVLMVKEGSLLAMFSSGWAVAKLPARFYTLLIEIFLMVGGTLLVIKSGYLLGDVKWREDAQARIGFGFRNALIPILAGAILVTSYNLFGRGEPISELLGYRFLLSAKPFSMAAAHRQLLSGLNRQTKVLALEAPWISSFANVNLDNVYHPLMLPPFKDASGETEKLLGSLDEIWVSHNFSREAPSIATQVYLRYHLHVEPFVEKALTRGWTVQDVEGFGKIYRRPELISG